MIMLIMIKMMKMEILKMIKVMMAMVMMAKVGNLRRFRCLDHCVALICQSRGDIPRRWAMIASMPKTP